MATLAPWRPPACHHKQAKMPHTSLSNPMFSEENRLKSFSGWTSTCQHPAELARNGFFFTRTSDHVQCAFCLMKLGGWDEGDDIETNHRESSRDCPFIVNKILSGNIPLKGEDTCGKYGTSSREQTYISVCKSLPNLSKGATYQEYCNPEKRQQSFEDWPLAITQRPEILTGAGFFYKGRGDQCICFYCGLGLKDWARTDDPWEEHAKWSPKCDYLIAKKGQAFVDKFHQDTPGPSEPKAVDEKQPANNRTAGGEKLCNVCFTQELGIIFLPCGHACVCVDCATQVQKCVICRKEINATSRIYLP